ncbi:Killer protein [Pasteurellaceae bacterium Macca]|nr:Killer protein [Pasteurellaceae bacterium Macca]MCK3656153.1 Killer protein [Pasteurellaceae bacterium Macca]MCK3656253.1 Killer protein [Pasteurellaceae bacterium Macca]MCK3656512.1 Killer protein [Pasteurellaceae bacterium Macca]MCK3657134.1 Killer protein [Pasteurellaceae bacterium Macca]
MILSFRHKGLEKFFKTGSTADIQAKHANRLNLQLSFLDAAKSLSDIQVIDWDLHPLKGNLKDHWSIKVNGNWRLTFKFENGHIEVLDYQDYH